MVKQRLSVSNHFSRNACHFLSMFHPFSTIFHDFPMIFYDFPWFPIHFPNDFPRTIHRCICRSGSRCASIIWDAFCCSSCLDAQSRSRLRSRLLCRLLFLKDTNADIARSYYKYKYIYMYMLFIYILYYMYIYIYVYSCLFILSLFNHVMPAPHRSLFVTLGRVTLIKASAAALVLNFAGESPGGIARRAICPFRGLPKNNGFICIMMIYIDLYRCLWIYYGLSPIYWYYVAAWKFTNMENDDQSWDQWKPKLRKWNPQVHWQHWVTDRADCWVWCLGSEPKIILDRWIKHGRDKTMWCYMILPSGYD